MPYDNLGVEPRTAPMLRGNHTARPDAPRMYVWLMKELAETVVYKKIEAKVETVSQLGALGDRHWYVPYGKFPPVTYSRLAHPIYSQHALCLPVLKPSVNQFGGVDHWRQKIR